MKYFKWFRGQPRDSYGKFDLKLTWKDRLKRWAWSHLVIPAIKFVGIPAFVIVLGFAGFGLYKALEIEQVGATIVNSENGVPPILQKIAQCESGNRQFNADGSVVRGRANKNDLGKYQINIDHWGFEAMKQNLNLLKEADNLKMAEFIFNTYGTSGWSSSQGCWSK